MVKDMNQYVLSLLENYPKMVRKIELISYELRFVRAVTPQELIEVMTFERKNTDRDSDWPHDVPGIAMNYKQVTNQLNQETANETLETYCTLLREKNRLQYYVGLLSPLEQTIITKYYINCHSWNEISKELGLSLRTVYTIRGQAIKTLSRMYSFTDTVFVSGKNFSQ